MRDFERSDRISLGRPRGLKILRKSNRKSLNCILEGFLRQFLNDFERSDQNITRKRPKLKVNFRLGLISCDSRGIQTHNLLIRSQMLYSVELGSRFSFKSQAIFFKSTAKVRSFWETTKYFGNFLRKNFCRAVFCWKMSGISRFFLIFASSTNLKYEE